MTEVRSKNSTRIRADKMKMRGAKGVSMRLLLSDKDRVPNFAMRLFEIEAKGHTPYHTHDEEHEVFVLSGKGYVKSAKGKTASSPPARCCAYWNGRTFLRGRPCAPRNCRCWSGSSVGGWWGVSKR